MDMLYVCTFLSHMHNVMYSYIDIHVSVFVQVCCKLEVMFLLEPKFKGHHTFEPRKLSTCNCALSSDKYKSQN